MNRISNFYNNLTRAIKIGKEFLDSKLFVDNYFKSDGFKERLIKHLNNNPDFEFNPEYNNLTNKLILDKNTDNAYFLWNFKDRDHITDNEYISYNPSHITFTPLVHELPGKVDSRATLTNENIFD